MNRTRLLAQIMPDLVGLLITVSILKMIGKSIPMPETPRNALMRLGGDTASFALMSIGALVALTLVLVNMTALKAQQQVQSFLQDANRDVERPSRSR
jgi:hypothetical protein